MATLLCATHLDSVREGKYRHLAQSEDGMHVSENCVLWLASSPHKRYEARLCPITRTSFPILNVIFDITLFTNGLFGEEDQCVGMAVG